jgi:WhiB family redox-sensing transcriptional regulator
MISLDAACRNDLELFSPAPSDQRDINAARAVCAQCPIRLDCLAVALATPDAQGIWGGLTQSERAAYRTRQTGKPAAPRDRPRTSRR